MKNDERFDSAIEEFDKVNEQDPRTEIVDGDALPKELLFARRVYAWVQKLVENPSETLLLATRSHTLRRWAIPRDRYAMTTSAYHEWRQALAELHAKEAEKILADVGYGTETIDTVCRLITRAAWPADADALALEDADCLVFLETKLGQYVDQWDEEKMSRVLRRTYNKMTTQAREAVATLNLGEKERAAIDLALSDAPTS
ncbi:MAG: DUF4202 domain-containing protein [Planctomycetes bacterium]|nr:DUF4202 domain-containing protein [Planctomycetota bacterium]